MVEPFLPTSAGQAFDLCDLVFDVIAYKGMHAQSVWTVGLATQPHIGRGSNFKILMKTLLFVINCIKIYTLVDKGSNGNPVDADVAFGRGGGNKY